MITIKHVLQFNVWQQSERIRRMKADAIKTEPARHWRFLSSDARATRSLNNPPEDPGGWSREWISYQKVVSWMSPRHPQWQEYCSAKLEASKWLTAIHLLKLGDGALPLKKDVRKAIRSGRLEHHVARSRASAFVFGAHVLLSKTLSDLAQDPAGFPEVQRFVADREREREGNHAAE